MDFYQMGEIVRNALVELYPAEWEPDIVSGLMRLRNGQWRFFDESFCGACAVASYMMQALAASEGIHLDIVVSPWHVWNEHNGKVVDVTFSQFRWDIPVYVGDRTGWHDLDFDGPTKLDEYPCTQNPNSFINRPKIERWLSNIGVQTSVA